ncbi:asparagine synthetase [Sorochytrium milnesiophthora]
MCGIFAALGLRTAPEAYRKRALELSQKLRHRGPDWSGIQCTGNNVICHERLSIMGIDSGAQPFTNADGTILLAVNGEIYNYRALQAMLKKKYIFKTRSDCEVIMYLYEEMGKDFVGLLDGMFSFVLYDSKQDLYLAARDPIGITTLYQGWSYQDGTVFFASEMKALNEECDRVVAFPPGHYYLSTTQETARYYKPVWWDASWTPALSDSCDLLAIRHGLERAVKKRLMTEVPYGVLLSGGLDSSLIAAIAVRHTQKAIANGELSRKTSDDDYVDEAVKSAAMWQRLHTFSIGLEGAPDLKAAQKVADYLGTIHHEFHFTVQEGLDALSNIIYHLETYDVTTVRASTPMYLLSRQIKAMGVKMVLSGEGSDEVFGGYLYFHNAPSAEAFHKETVARVEHLHTADCLRANKSTMAWGLEARVPFLDKEFLDMAMTLDPRHKMCSSERMEKYILRKAFDVIEGHDDDNDGQAYLPSDILWRQKEQFSDGVGYSWIDTLREHAANAVSDAKWKHRHVRFPKDTPATKEAYYYRELFDHHFPQPACLESVVRWVPRKDWGCAEDPSGRAQTAHSAAYRSKQQQPEPTNGKHHASEPLAAAFEPKKQRLAEAI